MDFLLELFYPKRCFVCKKEGELFCQHCRSRILQTDLVCPKCEKASIGGQVHPVCRRKFGLDGLWSLGVYQDPLKSVIKKLKYRHLDKASKELVEVVVDYWLKFPPFLLDLIKKDQGEEWFLTPVPLHWYRQNWRGFNQSALLAKLLAEKLGLKYQEVLKRDRYTKPQVKLKGYDRNLNIRGAFSLNPKYSRLNTKVILVDDVWTTGSTLKECCYVLKRAGVKNVWALTLAR